MLAVGTNNNAHNKIMSLKAIPCIQKINDFKNASHVIKVHNLLHSNDIFSRNFSPNLNIGDHLKVILNSSRRHDNISK